MVDDVERVFALEALIGLQCGRVDGSDLCVRRVQARDFTRYPFGTEIRHLPVVFMAAGLCGEKRLRLEVVLDEAVARLRPCVAGAPRGHRRGIGWRRGFLAPRQSEPRAAEHTHRGLEQPRRSVKDDATRQQRLRSEARQSCQRRMSLAHAVLGPAFLKHIVQILALKQITCCASLGHLQMVPMAAAEPAPSIRTLRLKVKREAYAWLKSAAIEVNAVWNFANETSYKAARPFAGPSRRFSAFDLDKLSAGACACFERIGSGTIQRVNAEYATRRRQFKRSKLRWRKSYGSHRSLGWVPFKAEQLGRRGKCLRFSGKAIRVFEQASLEGVRCKSGCFAEDSVGDWWL